MSHIVMITEKAVLLEWLIFFLSIHIKKYNNTIYNKSFASYYIFTHKKTTN